LPSPWQRRHDAADESRLFRFTIKHSVLLMAVMGLLSMFFAYVVPHWVPAMPSSDGPRLTRATAC
jgi:hypothetical protein